MLHTMKQFKTKNITPTYEDHFTSFKEADSTLLYRSLIIFLQTYKHCKGIRTILKSPNCSVY